MFEWHTAFRQNKKKHWINNPNRSNSILNPQIHIIMSTHKTNINFDNIRKSFGIASNEERGKLSQLTFTKVLRQATNDDSIPSWDFKWRIFQFLSRNMLYIYVFSIFSVVILQMKWNLHRSNIKVILNIKI